VLVDPADPSSIARGLLEVLGTTEAWQYYHQAGIDRVISRYTWERTAEGYLTIIRQALSEPARQGTLAIPAYFTQPDLKNEIELSTLSQLYFS
jgi:sucrose-phosphate synthase